MERLLEGQIGKEDVKCLNVNLDINNGNEYDDLKEQENKMVWDDTKNKNLSCDLHTINKIEVIKLSNLEEGWRNKETYQKGKIKRTKPRALVSTNFEVFTFQPLDFQEKGG